MAGKRGAQPGNHNAAGPHHGRGKSKIKSIKPRKARTSKKAKTAELPQRLAAWNPWSVQKTTTGGS